MLLALILRALKASPLYFIWVSTLLLVGSTCYFAFLRPQQVIEALQPVILVIKDAAELRSDILVVVLNLSHLYG